MMIYKILLFFFVFLISCTSVPEGWLIPKKVQKNNLQQLGESDLMQLNQTLTNVKMNLETREWDKFLGICEKAHKEQYNIGQKNGTPKLQYIGEVLQINVSDYNSFLNQLAYIVYDNITEKGEILYVEGYLILSDNSQQRFRMMLKKVGDIYQVSGALG